MLSIRKSHWPQRFFRSIQKHQDAWVLFFGVLAVGALSFEAGFLQGKTLMQAPLRIELAQAVPAPALPNNPTVQIPSEENLTPSTLKTEVPKHCVFVASRNSKLYHASTCAVVKRIKPENQLCFQTTSEAMARGLKPGCIQ